MQFYSKRAIALDFDGVIADTLVLRANWLYDQLGALEPAHVMYRGYVESCYGLSLYQRMRTSVGWEDTLNALPIEGSIDGIRRLSSRFCVVVLTARCNDKAYWAYEWLKKYRLERDISDVVSTYGHSKIAVAGRIGSAVLVDNDPDNLRQELCPSIFKVLFTNGVVQEVSSDIASVTCWSSLTRLLETRGLRKVARCL